MVPTRVLLPATAAVAAFAWTVGPAPGGTHGIAQAAPVAAPAPEPVATPTSSVPTPSVSPSPSESLKVTVPPRAPTPSPSRTTAPTDPGRIDVYVDGTGTPTCGYHFALFTGTPEDYRDEVSGASGWAEDGRLSFTVAPARYLLYGEGGDCDPGTADDVEILVTVKSGKTTRVDVEVDAPTPSPTATPLPSVSPTATPTATPTEVG